jgi:ABC-type transport system substrate-binding protein
VLTGHAAVHRADLHPGHGLGVLHGLGDGAGGLVDVPHHPAPDTVGALGGGTQDPDPLVADRPTGLPQEADVLMDTAPFNDNDVRMAMKLAIDREEQLKRILNGHGSIGNDQPLSAAYQFFDPNIPQTSYDPDKAKFHLKKAGHSDLAVQLYVSEVPYAGATDASVLYKEQAAKAGINIEVIRAPEDGYWSDVWAKKPFCAARWSGRINADVMIGGVYTGDALKAVREGWTNAKGETTLIRMVPSRRYETFTAAVGPLKFGSPGVTGSKLLNHHLNAILKAAHTWPTKDERFNTGQSVIRLGIREVIGRPSRGTAVPEFQ